MDIFDRIAILFYYLSIVLYAIGEPIRATIERFAGFIYTLVSRCLPRTDQKPTETPGRKKRFSVPKTRHRIDVQFQFVRPTHMFISGFLLSVLSRLQKAAVQAARILMHAVRLVSLVLTAIPKALQKAWGKIRYIRITRQTKHKKQQLILPEMANDVTVYSIPFGLKHTRLLALLAFLSGSIITTLFILIPFILFQWVRALPSPYLISSRSIDVTTKIFDRNGILLYEIYADQNRTPVPLRDIPDYVKEATIAIEDKEFYTHQGFSVRGITRAAREILVHDRIQGGSTITQQLVKTSLLTPEIKISRKIKEVVLAFWAEHIYTKDQILEMYLNQVPYGGTAWGIEAAAQTYFGKSVRDASLAEAALLAGLPAAPTKYSPFGTQKDLAIERQHEVLRRMVEDGYITAKEAQDAASQPLAFLTPTTPIKAPHFVMYVKELLESRYGTRLVEKGGLRITTSLDFNLQTTVEDIVARQVTGLAKLKVGNGATLITKPGTGEILAMVGSKNYFDTAGDGNVNVTTRLRQPGSSIKVVTYAAALENGFTAASILQDAPVIYKNPGSEPYAPKNYDNKFHGPVPVRYALGNSYNVPAVRVLEKIGVKTMLDKARAMGITSWTRDDVYGLALTLGAAETSMLEMATVYGTLANNGKRIDVAPVLEITDYTGQIIERSRPKPATQAVDPAAAWIISHILSDNVARAAAFGSRSQLVIPDKTVSVKTGTSNDKRDNWTIGYTPSYVVVVWVGNNDNTPMDQVLTSGITGATPIWHEIMAMLLRDTPDERPVRPDTIVEIPCYFGRIEYFLRGTEPQGGRCSPLPTPSQPKAETGT